MFPQNFLDVGAKFGNRHQLMYESMHSSHYHTNRIAHMHSYEALYSIKAERSTVKPSQQKYIFHNRSFRFQTIRSRFLGHSLHFFGVISLSYIVPIEKLSHIKLFFF